LWQSGADFSPQILSQFIGTHYTFLQGFILACVYTATQDSRGIKAQFFFFTVPAQLVPYCMMLVTFLMQGPNAALLQLNGLLAAHLYDFLTRILPEFGGFPNILQTPSFLSRLVDTPQVVERTYGTAIRGQTGQSSGSSTGASTGGGVLPDSWRSRGAGQRLGGS
jgi:Derlin-2/3